MRENGAGRPVGLGGRVRKIVVGAAGVAGVTVALQVPARADDPPTMVPMPQMAQADVARNFSITPQPLASALDRFAEQAGVSFAYRSSDLATLRSPGVSGSMTPREALQRLLGGTGVSFSFTGPTTVTLSRAPDSSNAMQLDPVQVQGNLVPAQAVIDNLPPPFAGGQVATGAQVGVLGERTFMNTPFNQTSYTSELMRNQNARTLADVVANDPSVRNSWSAVSYTTPLMIRGFNFNNNDWAFNGLYGVAPPVQVLPDYLERVEVLKGPNAMLNGMPPFGSVSGSINLVPKRAANDPLNRVTATYATGAQFGGAVDFGRRFGDDKEYGVRFNGTYRNGATAVDRQTQELGAAVFGMDFKGERVRLSFDYGYQTQTVNSPLRPTYVAAGVAVPAAPGGRANWFQPWTYMQTDDLFGAVQGEFDITPDWTAFAAIGGRQQRYSSLSGFATITNANGNLTDAPFNFPGWSNANTQTAGVRGRANTGPVSHALSVTGTRVYLENGSLSPVLVAIPSNLYNPTFVAKPFVPTLNPPKIAGTQLTSIAVADVASVFDDRIQFIFGGRLQRVQVTNFSNVTGAVTASYDQSAFSPALGFIVKPWDNVSIYGNWIEGLQQGPTAPAGTVNAGQMFAPMKTRQYEVGAKVDFGKFATTLSLFQIEQPSGFTNPSTAVFGVDGIQRNQGIELMVFGEPWEGFRPLGGITLMEGKLLSTATPLTQGKTAPGVPNVQLNLGAEWDASFLKGLTFSGRLIYTSAQYLDPANYQSIPGWTRFDAGVRYAFERPGGKPVALRLNVENLFDANYWASATSTFGLSMGAPRTFLLSLTTDF